MVSVKAPARTPVRLTDAPVSSVMGMVHAGLSWPTRQGEMPTICLLSEAGSLAHAGALGAGARAHAARAGARGDAAGATTHSHARRAVTHGDAARTIAYPHAVDNDWH